MLLEYYIYHVTNFAVHFVHRTKLVYPLDHLLHGCHHLFSLLICSYSQSEKSASWLIPPITLLPPHPLCPLACSLILRLEVLLAYNSKVKFVYYIDL